MRTGSKRILRVGIIAGLAYAIWRAWRKRVPQSNQDITWETAPFPFPPIPRPAHDAPAPVVDAPASAPVAPTADPASDGSCPLTHPVKAKLSSGIFHVPGGSNYDRTKADRCYVDAAAAEADGLRAAKH